MNTSSWVREDEYICREHRLSVPLDYRAPEGKLIEVFARELRRTRDDDLPYLLYLQGGPGFEVSRPAKLSAWQDAALDEFNLVLLDQRGTGLSTPFEASMSSILTDDEIATYLSFFRADSIVQDAEQLRSTLVGLNERWTILGQSFGGFCALTYLSFAPAGLERVLLTGGVPPVGRSALEVYERLSLNVHRRTRSFYDTYPEAATVVADLCAELESQVYHLPNGDPFHLNRLRSLGLMLGRSTGASSLYGLLEMSRVRGPDGRLSSRFLHAVADCASIVSNPLYAILHEAIYCEGAASAWSAQRVKTTTSPNVDSDVPLYFDGEMIFPWMFDEIGALVCLKGAAECLAQKSDWQPLYDVEQLRRNKVPTVALVYDEDMFVDRELSLETLDAVASSRVWSTNEYEHDGLRQDGRRIFNRLLTLAKDLIR